MRSLMLALTSACFGLAACAADLGTRPHDMSSTQHEAMAKSEDKSAADQAAKFDPKASVEQTRCGGVRSGSGACWTSTANPTASYLAEADRHRKLAAEHRAASQALRDAEARACVGLADADRDMSPFAHREDIAGVEEIVSTSGGGKLPTSRLVGARVLLRAVPGMTAPWLQRVVDCHLARNAALGHDLTEMPYCPLVPKDVSARVAEHGAEFAVEVTSSDPAVVQEIARRSKGLIP